MKYIMKFGCACLCGATAYGLVRLSEFLQSLTTQRTDFFFAMFDVIAWFVAVVVFLFFIVVWEPS